MEGYKPQPMAGFSGGLISPHKRAAQVKRKSVNQLFKNSAESESDKVAKLDDGGPPPALTRRLTPMSDLLESLLETENDEVGRPIHTAMPEDEPETPPALIRRLTPMSNLLESLLEDTQPKNENDGFLAYFPVDVDVDKLVDWKEEAVQKSASKNQEKNNNERSKDSEGLANGALVHVNNTDIAVFRYGDGVIATSGKCPHAGGPLHLGDIEVLPDRSLCIRCPWHKWAFCISGGGQKEQTNYSSPDARVGACVFPSSRKDKRLLVFPTLPGGSRRHIKIGFESIPKTTLVDEKF